MFPRKLQYIRILLCYLLCLPGHVVIQRSESILEPLLLGLVLVSLQIFQVLEVTGLVDGLEIRDEVLFVVAGEHQFVMGTGRVATLDGFVVEFKICR